MDHRTFVNTKLIEYRPPRIAMALLALAAVIHVLFPSQSSQQLWIVYLAGATVSAGFSVMMLAWWQFRERKIAICPTEPTESLITDGIYRITRNPMYLGMVLMLGGVRGRLRVLQIERTTLGLVRERSDYLPFACSF